jgi:hypothetical protein
MFCGGKYVQSREKRKERKYKIQRKIKMKICIKKVGRIWAKIRRKGCMRVKMAYHGRGKIDICLERWGREDMGFGPVFSPLTSLMLIWL